MGIYDIIPSYFLISAVSSLSGIHYLHRLRTQQAYKPFNFPLNSIFSSPVVTLPVLHDHCKISISRPEKKKSKFSSKHYFANYLHFSFEDAELL